MSRADRRLPADFREIFSERGLCLTAQGSSRLRFGDTEVIVTLNGPKETRIREIDTGHAQIRVKTYPEMHELNDIITTAIKNCLDCSAYPDSMVDLGIAIVSDQGSLLCCAINAAILSLHDAGLKLLRDVSASCFAFRGDVMIVDPSKREEENCDGVVTFVWARDTGEVFGSFFDGMIDPSMMILAIQRAPCMPNLLE
jgi:ribonuclease PH